MPGLREMMLLWKTGDQLQLSWAFSRLAVFQHSAPIGVWPLWRGHEAAALCAAEVCLGHRATVADAIFKCLAP